MPIFGVHESISGGFECAVERVAAVGGHALQMFVKSSQQWQSSPITSEQVARFQQTLAEKNVDPVVAHASYLVNLASPNEVTRQKSILGFANEIHRCAQLGIAKLVVHPGSCGLSASTTATISTESKSVPESTISELSQTVTSPPFLQTLPTQQLLFEASPPKKRAKKPKIEISTAVMQAGCERVADSLRQVFLQVDQMNPTEMASQAPYQISPQTVRVLLETTAGQGAYLGRRFEELATISTVLLAFPEATEHQFAQRIGVCVDTAHIFAAGYAFDTAEEYAALIAQVDTTVGLKNIYAFHINDSAKAFQSNVDRHAQLGLGLIGLDGIAHFVRDPRWKDHPMLLETPKGTDETGTDYDIVNLRILERLALGECCK